MSKVLVRQAGAPWPGRQRDDPLVLVSTTKPGTPILKDASGSALTPAKTGFHAGLLKTLWLGQ